VKSLIFPAILLFPFSAQAGFPEGENGSDLSVEFYGTVGDKVFEAMNGTGVPYKIFKTKFGYSRV